ncbi:Foldase protein PrsA precursor [Fimbriiglobus ruber]|uniref:peptidylprolyl isomerase n=2 Tax=Fimbriiglobus ruber TaxID=1908690 RepID=A0A225DZD1_9BACT|nr:Foldase protein PrsA precursor [Fimbriiglobus ruber]
MGKESIASINGNTLITRAQLGEYLIERLGADKVELFVNRMIIDAECKKRGVTVTDPEMLAALMEDVGSLGIRREDFIKLVLPRYNKSFYEWMEDVIRPRLLLGKLCRDRISVTEEDLRIQFEREFGEKRQIQIIIWPKGDDLKAIEKEYAKIRGDQVEFDRAARAMANPSLAAAGGHIKPISRHLYSTDKVIEERSFQLKVGEVSEVISTSQGFLVMKLHAIIPARTDVKFDGEKVRLEKQAKDEKLTQEIPKYFAELKTQAQPLIYEVAPAKWRMDTAPAQESRNVMGGIEPVSPRSPTAPSSAQPSASPTPPAAPPALPAAPPALPAAPPATPAAPPAGTPAPPAGSPAPPAGM